MYRSLNYRFGLCDCAGIAFVLVGLAAAPSSAQDDADQVSGSVGADGTHAYFFRGIVQETEGFILKPYAEVGFNLYDGSEGLTSVDVIVGQWNSLHSGPTGADRPTPEPFAGGLDTTKMWYEADFYCGVALGLDNFQGDITYASQTSPNNSFGTVKELALGLAMDDSAFFGPYAMSPHVRLAIELDGQADGGSAEGTYLEFGVEPGLALVPDVVNLSFPINVGLSLNNYYEDGAGFNDTFGFFEVGALVAVPLTMPPGYGDWELSGGIKLLALGSYLESLNGGDTYQPVGYGGFSIGY